MLNTIEILTKYTHHQTAKLTAYAERLMHYNEQVNLTGAKTMEDLVVKHVVDSVFAFEALQKVNNLATNQKHPKLQNIIDIGSGGGLPGIVLAILLPETKVFLVERRVKKASYLEKIISDLKLDDQIMVVAKPMEEAKHLISLTSNPWNTQCWVRGFLPGPKLIAFLSEFFEPKQLRPLILMKGPSWQTEKEEALKQNVSTAWKERFLSSQELEYQLPNNSGSRTLVIL